MKLIHTSDWHIGKSLNEYSLLEMQREILGQIQEILRDEKGDALIIAGDLYDRSIPPADAVSLLDQTLTKIVTEQKVPVLMISGNHDSAQRLAFGGRMLEETGLHIGSKLEDVMQQTTLYDEFGPVHFTLLPYFEPVHVRQMLGEDSIHTYNDAFAGLMEKLRPQIRESERNVLIAHGFYVGMDHGVSAQDPLFSESETSVGAADIIDLSVADFFDYIALGHLHAPQKTGNDAWRYSGSPLKYSVSEKNQQKSVTVVEFGEGKIPSLHQVPLIPSRDLRVVEGTIEELLQADDPKPDDYIYALLTDTGDVMDAMQRLKAVYPNVLGLRRLADEIAPAEFSVTAPSKQKSAGELFEEFYEQVNQAPMNDRQRKLMEEILRDADKAVYHEAD